MGSVDVRSKRDADVRRLDPVVFCEEELPRRLTETGEVAARGMAVLGLPPLVIEVEARQYTFRSNGDVMVVRDGADDDAVVLALGPEAFSDCVQEVRTVLALLLSGEAEVLRGSPNAAIRWDTVLRAMVDGRAVYVPGTVPLLDRDGSPLDVHRSFGPDDDVKQMSWFLEQAGFLVLRGWLEPTNLATISADIDRAFGGATPEDPRSWWATMADGSRRCVRIKHFDELSETAVRLVGDDIFGRIRSITGDSFPLPASIVEVLVKPAGVVTGVSDIRWHKDCWQGRHPYRCCGMTIGVLLTPSNAETGFLRVMAGSHRASLPAIDRDIENLDLPLVDLHGAAGDITVHLSCTLHEAVAPAQAERRVMYAGFALEATSGGSAVDNGLRMRHVEWVNALTAAWDEPLAAPPARD